MGASLRKLTTRLYELPSWCSVLGGPRSFKGHYTEKADVFSLGVIFFAILERDFIRIGGERYFGAFKFIEGECVGLGYAMWRDPRNGIKFTRRAEAQGSRALRDITLSALKFDKNDRPSARKIHQELICGQENPRETSDPGFAHSYSGIGGETSSPLYERGRSSEYSRQQDIELAPARPRATRPHSPENSSPCWSFRQRDVHFRRRHVTVGARRFRHDQFSFSVREETVSVDTDDYSRPRSPPRNSSPSRWHGLFPPQPPTYPHCFQTQSYPHPLFMYPPMMFGPQPLIYPQPLFMMYPPMVFAPQPLVMNYGGWFANPSWNCNFWRW